MMKNKPRKKDYYALILREIRKGHTVFVGILIIALLFITSCREKPPKLKSGQAVKVTEGFYENCEGIVISYTYDVFSPKYPDVQYYVVKINKHCPTAIVGFYYEILQTVKQEL